jgi:hypothetical protein
MFALWYCREGPCTDNCSGTVWCRLAAMLQIAVRDEDAERREYSSIGANSAGEKHSSDGPQDEWDAPRELSRIPVIPPADEVQENEGDAGAPEFTLEDAFGPLGGRLGTMGMFGKDGGMLVAAQAPIQPVSALDRLMARNNALFGGIKAPEPSSAAEFVYPDIPLIRLILKTIANLLRATHVSGTYSAEYRGELASWLRELEIGPPTRDGGASSGSAAAPGRVRLLRVVRRDETVAFYFNQIASHS